MKAILRHPATGVLTLATSARWRSSSGLGPIAMWPAESVKTARRQPPEGRLGAGLSIRSVVNSPADRRIGRATPPSPSSHGGRAPLSEGATAALDEESGTS